MEIRIKGDSVEVEGYVNAIERKSKPLRSRMGKFVERICKGAFKRALERNDDVRILLNHDTNKDLGGTKDGNLELKEDSIGLHARAKITDHDVVEKAKNGDLVGWSFGFQDRDVENKRDEDGFPLRDVKDLDLVEVSLLDRSRTPAYDGTLVCVRADDDETIMFGEMTEDEIVIRSEETKEELTQENPVENKQDSHYEEYKELLNDMKA